MRRIASAVAAALIVLVSVGAQDAADEDTLKEAGVDQDARAKAVALYRSAAEKTETLRADLKTKEAELSKMLVPETYDAAAVEKKLHEISDLEVAIRLNRISTEMELRALIGKEKWARVRKVLRERAAAEAAKSKRSEGDAQSAKPGKQAK